MSYERRDDDAEDYSGNVSGLGSLGGKKQGLGSLAQAARRGRLRTCRNVFIVIGILQLFVGIVLMSLAAKPDSPSAARVLGEEVDASDQAVVEAVGRVFLLFAIIQFGVALTYFVFAATVQIFPIPISIAGLILYLGCLAIGLYGNPAMLLNPLAWIIQILIISFLVRGVRAAFAYQKDKQRAAEASAELSY